MSLKTFGLFLTLIIAAWNTQAAEDILPVEEAFRYHVDVQEDSVAVRWDITEGYYLYRPRMKFASRNDTVRLGSAAMPPGKPKEDEFFGKTEIYRDQVRVLIPFAANPGTSSFTLEIKSQGCADIGLCYPPQTWTTDIALPVTAVSAAPAPQRNLLAELAGQTDDEFLPPDEAFRFYAELSDDNTLVAKWDIAEGYYLYRDKFALSADSAVARLAGEPGYRDGKRKHDEFFGEVEVYYQEAVIRVPLARTSGDAGEMQLTANYQGCAEDGICYPPITRTTLVMIPAGSADSGVAPAAYDGATGSSPPVSEQDRLATLIRDGSLPLVMATFFGLGLLLAFTPCVLPMVPILSGIIAGQGAQQTTRQSFTLSLIYVLAMALTYTAAGVIVALLGKNVQAIFQNPAIIIGFSVVFVLLALAMFEVFELQMPASVQGKLAAMSNRQQGGKFAGVATMGVLSALIVGPCVAAPLVAALIFIGQSGDAVRGGLTLFALSMGMGAPLLAFGASAGRLMVHGGPWMVIIRRLFGIMLLGVAIWLLARILPGRVIVALWAALAIGTAMVLGAFRAASGRGEQVARMAGFGALAYGALLAASAAAGGYDPLSPLRGTPLHTEVHLEFQRIKTVDDLRAAVARAAADGRPAMLDFYADWCVSCKEMEKYTFTDGGVQNTLANTLLLQADVTANDNADQALYQHFGIYGPPTIAFFTPDGNENRPYRVVGFMPADQFAGHAAEAIENQ